MIAHVTSSNEAVLIGRYLLGEMPSAVTIATYGRAVAHLPPLDTRDQKLLDLATRHPVLLGFIDAGLALRAADSPLRRRIHLMFAALECSPQHTRHFLAERSSSLALFGVLFTGIRAVVRSVLGALLLATVR